MIFAGKGYWKPGASLAESSVTETVDLFQGLLRDLPCRIERDARQTGAPRVHGRPVKRGLMSARHARIGVSYTLATVLGDGSSHRLLRRPFWGFSGSEMGDG